MFRVRKADASEDGDVTCLRCGHDESSNITTRKICECGVDQRCGSLPFGTIVEDSSLDFDQEPPSIRLIADSKSRISSHKWGRARGVTQKAEAGVVY